jgi:hypothetical protein
VDYQAAEIAALKAENARLIKESGQMKSSPAPMLLFWH